MKNICKKLRIKKTLNIHLVYDVNFSSAGIYLEKWQCMYMQILQMFKGGLFVTEINSNGYQKLNEFLKM